MTSIELFPSHPQRTDEPPEWGTGKLKSDANLWVPKGPNWHQTGKPIEQYYTLTQLKQSNVRTNDQLLPDSKDAKMGDIMIDESFPAEHPYASHTPRFAVFPKFDSPDDPTRGVDARTPLPKHAEMPSQPYDITIVSKSKGNGLRHEIQAYPPESQKKALVWHEHSFDQKVKSPSGGQQPYYPTPPKTFVPNLEKRSDSDCIKGNMEIRPRTANALRNVERNQWQTTYDLSHTGLGPSNPLKLDNMDDKVQKLNTTGTLDDKLYPRSVPTFDPPRPMEGRIAQTLTPRGEKYTDQQPDSSYKRMMSLTEREEDRLWNGKEYVNLPGGETEDQWKYLNDTAHPDAHLDYLSKNKCYPDQVPFHPTGAPEPISDGYSDKLANKKHDAIQQMEASNRWKVLESQKPHHDVSALQHKMDMASVKEKPDVFYNHEGKYQRERAGLYKTSYDPYSLQHSMNKDETTGKLFDTTDCHKDALNLPVDLNQDMADAMRYCRTLGGPPGSVPQYNSQPTQYEAIEPFNTKKYTQKSTLQPQVNTADVRTQENGIVLTESTKGSSYDTQKFLQEHVMPPEFRKEPLLLMSNQNQDLGKMKSTLKPGSRKSVHFADDIMVAAGAGSEPLRLSSANIENPREEQPYPDRPATSPPKMIRKQVSFEKNNFNPVTVSESKPSALFSLPVELPKNRISSRHMPNGVSQFESKSTNIQPSNSKYSWAMSSAYETQFPGGAMDLSFKDDDPRFHYRVGSGLPRPQSTLLKIQDSFTRSDTKKKFYQVFPETNPDLRENITRGKRHTFDGFNAQTLRGTPVLA